MSDSEHRSQTDDLAAYALGALTERETERLEKHLDGCERCREELRWLRSAVDAIAAGVEPRKPGRRLRRELMAAARADVGAQRAPLRRTGALAGARPTLAAAAVAGVLAAGVIGYAFRGDGSEAVTVAGRPTELAPPGADATLVRADSTATLAVSGLGPLRGGDVYQAWVRNGAQIEPSTAFIVNRAGHGAAAIPQPLDGVDEVLVTREPRGGSIRPSTAPLLRATLG